MLPDHLHVHVVRGLSENMGAITMYNVDAIQLYYFTLGAHELPKVVIAIASNTHACIHAHIYMYMYMYNVTLCTCINTTCTLCTCTH
jgi:hypothetical protein